MKEIHNNIILYNWYSELDSNNVMMTGFGFGLHRHTSIPIAAIFGIIVANVS